jgi:NADP-dependent 3-hydroxy acid dehydrogenase YdfG
MPGVTDLPETTVDAEARAAVHDLDSTMAGRLALIAGGSEGIGRAIALALAARGDEVWIVARRQGPLEAVVEEVRAVGGTAVGRSFDLVDDADRAALVAEIGARAGGLDVLVHANGTIARADIADAAIDDFDRQYAANVRAPYALTQALLPSLIRAGGQVVFVNSSAGLAPSANAAQYGATMHALRAVANVLRDEVNPAGVRVTTVYPGRTATPRQARIHEWEGKEYHPERLLQPEDVASIVVAALDLPRTAEVTDISIRSMTKP